MKHWKTKNGTIITQVLWGRSNAYLLSTNQLNILVDTGKTPAFQKLLYNIRQLVPANQKIDYLILTHTHFDHCQNAFQIQNEEKCTVILGKEEYVGASEGYTPIPNGSFAVTKLIVRIGKQLGAKHFGFTPFIADIQVDEKLDLIEKDLAIRLLKTDGHSSGSISVIVDNEIALVGDVLFGVFRNSVMPPYSDDIPTMIKSWGKLLETDCKFFLPGHGKAITRELLQKEYDHYRKKLI